MNLGLTLCLSFSFVQTSFREFGEAGLCTVDLGYTCFHKKLVGVLGKEEPLPWPHTPLSALSF